MRFRPRVSTVAPGRLIFLAAFLLPRPSGARDCDRNGTEDSVDIERGATPDCDLNGVPDECDLSPTNLLLAKAIDTPLEGERADLGILLLQDFDRDGVQDLVTFSPENLLYLRGNGEGSFIQPAVQTGMTLVTAALSADMNGDGLGDVAGFMAPHAVFAMTSLGKGDGTFDVPQMVLAPGGRPAGITGADLDGDGAVDLAAVNTSTSAVTPWWNTGAGALALDGEISAGGPVASLASADVEGDGDVDLAVSSPVGSGLGIFRNQGARRFGVPEYFLAYSGGSQLTFADLDGDGDPDAALASDYTTRVSILRNGGAGDFSIPEVHETEGASRRLAAGDLDGDGAIDLVTVKLASPCGTAAPAVSVLLNGGNGDFRRREWPIALDPFGLGLRDLDGDGGLDVVVGRYPGMEGVPFALSVLRGRRGPAVPDEDMDGVPDSCAVEGHDCNGNGIPDGMDLGRGTSKDCNGNGAPDECEPDCDRNGIPDACDLAGGAADGNANGLLDACEASETTDCNGNGSADEIDLANATSADCDGNRVPDECDVRPRFDFSLGPSRRIQLGLRPGGAAAGDFDRDGDLDVAVATRANCCGDLAPGSISLLVNLEGRLARAGGHVPDADPDLVETLDADGDGDLDLVGFERRAPCRGAPGALVFSNDGRGDFVRAGGFRLALDPAAAVTADLDGDGDTDLVIGNDGATAPAAAIRFLNDGKGSFGRGELAGPPGGVSSLAAGDWDRDGRVDLALSDLTPALILLRNEGGGAFTSSRFSTSPDPAFLVARADLEGDGDLDLITVNREDFFGPGKLLHFSNDGAGAFSTAGERRITAHPRCLLTGDWDGDAILDIAVGGEEAFSPLTNDIPGVVSFIFGKGDGTFAEETLLMIEGSPSSVVGGDMDLDGDLDLVVMDAPNGNVDFFANEGGGKFGSLLPLGLVPGPRSLFAADLDGDGAADLAAPRDDRSVIVISRGGGGPRLITRVFREGLPQAPAAIAAGDLDGDGDLDMAVAGSQEVGVLTGSGGGGFAARVSLRVGSNPIAVAAADLDRDGRVDLITANSLSSGFSDNVTVFRNRGAALFEAGRNFVAGIAPVGLVVSDLDGDDFPDVAIPNGSASVSILENLGGTGLSVPRVLALGHPAFAGGGSDVDLDGDTDLLVATDAGLFLLTNLVEEGFLKAVRIVEGLTGTFRAADLDGEGDPDLVVVLASELRLLRNLGTGRFDVDEPVPVAPWLSLPTIPLEGGGGSDSQPLSISLAVDDLDGDGDNDLALGLVEIGRIIIAPNRTSAAKPDANGNLIPDDCETPSGAVFRRGDARGDGLVNITDAVIILDHLFLTGEPLACRKAADANDDGRVDVSDAVAILGFLFLGTTALEAPFPGCGPDPTPDLVDCAGQPSC